MLVMLSLHTFFFSLGEILLTDGLVFNIVPPVGFFAVPPLGVTFVAVDVVAVGCDCIARDLELFGHCLDEGCVGGPTQVRFVPIKKV
jgi:hypothetical protein